MNKIMKTIALTVAAGSVLASCAKWTETEPIKVTYETIQTKNPELYAKYLQSLRDFRTEEHPVLIAKFDNVPTVPAARSEHINALPDSIDYVVLTNSAEVSDAMVAEAAQIEEQKGILTLAEVDLEGFAGAYTAMIDAEQVAYEALEEPTEADVPVDTPERFESFVTPKVEAALKGADKIGALYVVFSARNPYTWFEEKKAEVASVQSILFAKVNEWLAAHSDALVIFEGVPGHIVCETEVVNRARYIVVPAYSATNGQSLTYEVLNAIFASPEMPTDRVVIGVATLDPYDDAATDGIFYDGGSAIEGAAEWCVVPEQEFTKKGVCVSHSQFGYYGKENVYAEIGKAIAIMNPSISK